MQRRDPNTLDLSQQHLCLADDLYFWPVRERGECVYRIEVPSLNRFFRVGYEEYVFLSLLDGKTTIPQACGLAAATLGSRAPSSVESVSIAKWLLSNGLAYLSTADAPSRDRDRNSPASKKSFKWLSHLNPFWFKFPIPNAQHVLKSFTGLLRPLLSSRGTVLGVGVMLLAVSLLVMHWSEFNASSSALFLPGNWFGMLIVWLILKVIHELAHATACESRGGKVTEAGIVLVLFAPLAYVDVSSCWRISSRWSRIAVAAAGMYIELLIASCAILMWWMSDSVSMRFVLYQIIVTAGVSTLLFNANVLMRFDGYFILADLIDVPNLYREGSLSVRHSFARIVMGTPGNDRRLGTWRSRFVFAYGIAALLWRVFVSVSLLIAASAMFHGAGMVLAIMGLALWLAEPLRSLVLTIRNLMQAGLVESIRPIVVGGGLVAVATSFVFLLPFPTAVSVPSVIDFVPEATLRSRAAGFITTIHVSDGDSVRAGDRLLDLENRELVHQLAEMELTWQQNEIRLRGATDSHDTAQQQVWRENQLALSQQMQPLRDQVAALTVVAPRDGQVIAPALANRLGQYVAEGGTLMIVAGNSDKEIVAVIEQEQIEEARQWLNREVHLLGIGYPRFTGRLRRIEPRASDRLASASLAATEGGSLAVRPVDDPNDDEPLRLLKPAFRGRVELDSDAAHTLPAGMRLRAWLGYHAEPLASRWYAMFRGAGMLTD